MGRGNRRTEKTTNSPGRIRAWIDRLDPHWPATIRGIAGRAGFAAATVILVIVGMRVLERFVGTLPPYTRPLTLQWENLPDWLRAKANGHVLDELTEACGLTFDDHMLDAHLAERIGQRLSAPGLAWVRRVERIEVRSGGIVAVSASFRRPAAWVRRGDACYLIADDGVRLNGRYSRASVAGSAMIVLDGVRGPVPAVGSAWDDPDVRAGLRLVQACATRAFRDQIASIRMQRVVGRDSTATTQFELVTDRGQSTICWGRPPGHEDGCEISAEQKLALLESLYRQSGRIDMHCDHVNITTWPDRVALKAPLGPQAHSTPRTR